MTGVPPPGRPQIPDRLSTDAPLSLISRMAVTAVTTACSAAVAVVRRLPLWSVPTGWTLALGLWGLSRQHTVWRDEAATWQVARRSAADIWHMLGQVDVVHGFYYLLMHGLFECFGPGTTTLRLPSVLAMAVAAACVTVIGRRLAGVWAGLGAGWRSGCCRPCSSISRRVARTR